MVKYHGWGGAEPNKLHNRLIVPGEPLAHPGSIQENDCVVKGLTTWLEYVILPRMGQGSICALSSRLTHGAGRPILYSTRRVTTVIQVNISAEALTDIAFVENDMARKCVTGLKDNYPIIEVSINDGIVTFIFDDGKPSDLKRQGLTYTTQW